MARVIAWHKDAEDELDQIIEYLLYEWTEKVAQNYLSRVKQVANLVAESPEIGMASTVNDNIPSFLITKHSTTFYMVLTDQIIVLNIFDNRQDPAKRRY
jgi:plasmid stabilization system protein ParE